MKKKVDALAEVKKKCREANATLIPYLIPPSQSDSLGK